MIDKKKHFIRIIYNLLFVFYILLSSGCDQIKSRIFSFSEETSSRHERNNSIDNNSDLKAKKVDDQIINSPEQISLPMVEQINQNEDIQFELIKENSKKTINKESYSIIGTKRGKPFRNSNSE